jgi:hypothetical protein
MVDGKIQLPGASQALAGFHFHHVTHCRGSLGYGDYAAGHDIFSYFECYWIVNLIGRRVERFHERQVNGCRILDFEGRRSGLSQQRRRKER